LAPITVEIELVWVVLDGVAIHTLEERLNVNEICLTIAVNVLVDIISILIS
jgi:hypothetical protein